jgi:hypothetical protein
MNVREQQVAAIAEAFAEVIRQWLTEDEIARVRERNAFYDDKVCATHDFCDANMAMLPAFQQVMEREPDADSMEDAALWSDAWGLAKRLYFTA